MSEKELNKKEMKDLFEAVSKLRDASEAKKFMRDLCTFSELKAMAERLQIAKLINKQETYRNINAKTGASTATVTRVAHWVHHGMGGYKLLLERLK